MVNLKSTTSFIEGEKEARMKSISLYKPLDTPVHQLEPITKLFYVFAVILLPILWGSRWVTVGCIVMSLIFLKIGKVLKKAMPILACSSIIILTVIIIQGLFRAGNETPFIRLGKVVFYKEGLLFAVGIGLNVVNLILGFSVLVLTTKPSDLVEALVRKGLSPKIGYVISSVFQIIPQMSATMETISDAQRSRGLETEGGLLTRIKAFLPLIGPVVMNSLIATRERAIALEVRGFNSTKPKSYINTYEPKRIDHVIQGLILMIGVLSVIGRIFIWQHLL